jgi:hypothetical protein
MIAAFRYGGDRVNVVSVDLQHNNLHGLAAERGPVPALRGSVP